MYAVDDVEDKAALARLAILTADALKAGSAKSKKSKPVKKASKAAPKLDYKKAYKELYLPKTAPSLIEVPKMTFIAASGKGAPGSDEYRTLDRDPLRTFVCDKDEQARRRGSGRVLRIRRSAARGALERRRREDFDGTGDRG